MVGGKIVGSAVLAIAALAAGSSVSRGQSIPVPNHSFEDPAPLSPGAAAPGALDWTTTGGVGTGRFGNLPAPIIYNGVQAQPIYNADPPPVDSHGNPQLSTLAYISAQYDPNNIQGGGVAINEFYQQLSNTYQPGQEYVLSVGVAKSSVQPPADTDKLRIELYYTVNGVQQPLVFSTVNAGSLQNDMLSYLMAQLPAVQATDPWANQPIGILLSTTDNTPTSGGDFDMDNVTLTAVPEPAGALCGVIAAAGLALGRRRRVEPTRS